MNGVGTNYGSIGSTASQTALAPAAPNFAASVDYAGERVGLLIGRLSELTDKLCGSAPQDEASGLSPVANGLFDAVMDRAMKITRFADEGQRLLDRIERALP